MGTLVSSWIRVAFGFPVNVGDGSVVSGRGLVCNLGLGSWWQRMTLGVQMDTSFSRVELRVRFKFGSQ